MRISQNGDIFYIFMSFSISIFFLLFLNINKIVEQTLTKLFSVDNGNLFNLSPKADLRDAVKILCDEVI